MLRSATGVDVLLTVLGVVYLMFTGAVLSSAGTVIVRPALAVGFLVPFAVAATVSRVRDRLAGLEEWFGSTRQGRVAFLALLLTIVGFRFGLGLAPEPIQDAVLVGTFGAAGGMVGLAVSRAAGRAARDR
ncbi:hypothetical protein [Haloglomus halophilum]|uniref:hypothetical protein n=1 Tax=Haloglomus halophilum TaxID=2962672 RepID=UPI0020C9E594|nr:hypothetical protein [Haloglomus halophilum]